MTRQVLSPSAESFLAQLFHQFSRDTDASSLRVLTEQGQAEVQHVLSLLLLFFLLLKTNHEAGCYELLIVHSSTRTVRVFFLCVLEGSRTQLRFFMLVPECVFCFVSGPFHRN